MNNANSGASGTLLVWGTFDATRPRVRVLLEGLQAHGYPLEVINADVWRGVRDRGTMSARAKAGVATRWLRALPALLASYRRAPAHRAVLVPYPGLFDLFALLPLARARGVPVIWDMFISPYDTVVNDRRMLPRWHPLAVLLYALEWLASRMVSGLFLDTEAHARRFERLMRLPAGRVQAVPLGTDPARFPPRPRESPNGAPGGPFRVLFYGQYIPLHGLETIVRAAHLAESRGANIRWTLVGAGQEQAMVTQLIATLGVGSVEQKGWVAPEALPALIHDADVGLGVFGTSGKALTVVPNKVYELAAAQATIVTADTPAMREFGTGHPRIHLVPPGDPEALAAVIMRLAREPGADGRPLPVVGPLEVAAAFRRVVDATLHPRPDAL